MTTVYDIPLQTLAGELTTLASLRGKALLIVNVASKCDLTPQYSGLERIHERFAGRNFASCLSPGRAAWSGSAQGMAGPGRAGLACGLSGGRVFSSPENLQYRKRSRTSTRHVFRPQPTDVPEASRLP
jgi:glutathione peroxidase